MSLNELIPWRIRSFVARIDRRLAVRRYKAYAKKHPKPIVAITGSVGKTTTCRMLAHVLEQEYSPVGASGTQGMWIGNELVKRGDHSGGYSALQLLADRRCNAVVAEIARGGLLSSGLQLDAIDVGVLLNVYDNHLGLKGIDTREQLGDLKSIVIRKATSCAVLNADDPICLSYYDSCPAERIYLVSSDEHNPALASHRTTNGRSVLFSDGLICLFHGETKIGCLAASEIPDSHDGMYKPGIISAINVIAVADGLGLSFSDVSSRLKSFRSTELSNPGRMNNVEGLPYKLWLTWADGPQAMKEIGILFKERNCDGRKIIMLAPMGNRTDHFLQEMASEVKNAFDYFICSDWEDLRGQPSKHVANLLAEQLHEEGVSLEYIYVAETHTEAIAHAFSIAGPNDMVLLVTMSGAKVLKLVDQMRKKKTLNQLP